MDTVQFIAAKRDGQEHRPGELDRFIAAATRGEVADYQLAAWLMASYLRGLSEAETLELTGALRDSGRTFPLGHFGPKAVDKHSTGGVGDKTSLVIVPLCASLGAVVPKMSGRGLGFTGGTLDKLDAIPGFNSDLGIEQFERVVARVGAAIAAQSADLVPADGRLYALRDVTATVDSIPLIAASVMSKKLALGCPSIVLDVKVGSGAFMTDRERGHALAATMVAIGITEGRRMAALLATWVTRWARRWATPLRCWKRWRRCAEVAPMICESTAAALPARCSSLPASPLRQRRAPLERKRRFAPVTPWTDCWSWWKPRAETPRCWREETSPLPR